FAPGAFNVRALSYFSSARQLRGTRQANVFSLNWPTNDPTLGLQYATNLSSSNWTTFHKATLTNGLYTFQETADRDARFYRLISPCAGTDAPVIVLRTNAGMPFNGINYNVNNQITNWFDASDSYDPAACTSGTLRFCWGIFSVDFP